MLIFVKLLCRQKIGFPVRLKVYGLDDRVPSNEAVFYCWDWQDFIKRMNGFCVYERKNCICWILQTVHVWEHACMCLCVCSHVCMHTCLCLRMHMHALAHACINRSFMCSSLQGVLGETLLQCRVYLKLAHRASIQGVKRVVKVLKEYPHWLFKKKVYIRKKHDN